MNVLKSRITYSVLFYLLTMFLIIVSKPKLVFDDRGKAKPFGVGEDRTLFSFGILTVMIAIITFYVFTLIDVVYSPSAIHSVKIRSSNDYYQTSNPTGVAERASCASIITPLARISQNTQCSVPSFSHTDIHTGVSHPVPSHPHAVPHAMPHAVPHAMPHHAAQYAHVVHHTVPPHSGATAVCHQIQTPMMSSYDRWYPSHST